MPYSRGYCSTCKRVTIYNEDGCVRHGEGKKMNYAEEVRTRRIRELKDHVQMIIDRGQASIDEVDKVLAEIRETQYFPQIISALKNKN